MDAAEESGEIVGQFVVPEAQDFLEARRKMGIAGGQVPVEDAVECGFGH